jgi:hypothetical protein
VRAASMASFRGHHFCDRLAFPGCTS